MAHSTVTLTGNHQFPDGTPKKGRVDIIPSVEVILDAAGHVILSGRVKIPLDEAGSFSVDLPATDDNRLNPVGFGYTVVARLDDTHLTAVSFQLPAAVPTVDMSQVTPVDPETFTPGATYASMADLATHTGSTANPHGVTKAQVGLGSVDNTSDAAKPVSTAQAAALAAKLDAAQRETASGVAGLTSAGKLYEVRIPDRLSDATLSATYAPVDENQALRPGAFASLRAAVEAGQASSALSVIGDSTGNETTEWVYLLAQHLATLNAGVTVEHRLWNDTTQEYDAATIVQSGGAERGIVLNGTTAQGYMFDTTAGQIVGDIDIRVRAAATNWTAGTERTLAAKWSGASQHGWQFYLDATNKPTFRWGVTGTEANSVSVTGFTPPANNVAVWLRVTVDVDNGAAGKTFTFYTSTDGVTWTQIAAPTVQAGTTSLFASTSELQYGARGGAAGGTGFWAGTIYRVQVRDGIGGKIINPVMPEHWDKPYQCTFTGAPVLNVVNGSKSGADLAYISDATRLPKMLPNYGQVAVVMSCSHNDGDSQGVAYFTSWSTLLTAVRARLPLSQAALSTQNPKTAPAANIEFHAIRYQLLLAWAARNGLSVIDAYAAFLSDGRAMSTLVSNTDGIHPTTAGSLVWAGAAIAAVNRRA